MPRTQGINQPSVNRQILAIAWPAIVSNITTPLLGLVDTAIAGHLGSSVALAAIALGSTVFNLIYWLFGFLRMSTAGLTAQAFGEKNLHAQAVALRRSLLMAVSIGIILIAINPWTGDMALRLLDGDDSVRLPALKYFQIVIWGAPAMLATYSLNGWLIGMQNTRLPMAIAVMTNIVNIALSFTFVFGLGMKIEGIALGTLLSQWISAVVCVVCLWRRYHPLKVGFPQLGSGLARTMTINVDIFLRTLCMVGVTAWFTRAGASQGVDVLAANALLMQLFLLFSYFTDGFAYAGEALSGKFFGASDFVELRRTVRHLLIWGGGVSLIFTALYFFAGEFILRILTDRHEIVDRAVEYLPWAVSIPMCGIFAFIYDGVFIGLTLTRRMLVSVAAGMAVFFAIYFTLRSALGNHALWLAFITYLLVRGITLHFALHKNRTV